MLSIIYLLPLLTSNFSLGSFLKVSNILKPLYVEKVCHRVNMKSRMILSECFPSFIKDNTKRKLNIKVELV